MVNVQFDENNLTNVGYRTRKVERVASKMVILVMKIGLAKNERSAQHVLVGISCIFFAVAFFVSLSLFKDNFKERAVSETMKNEVIPNHL